MSQAAPRSTRLARAGLIGPPLFVVSFLVQGALRSGYDPSRNTVSELALGSGGWVQTASFVMLALALAAVVPALRGALRGARRRVAAPWLLAVASACLLVTAAVPTDPIGIAEPTAGGGVHNGVFLILMLALVGACLSTARAVRHDAAWTGMARTLRLVAAGIVLGLVAFIGSGEPQPGVAEPLLSFGGLQRVLLVVAFGWVPVVAWRLQRVRRAAPPAPTPAGVPVDFAVARPHTAG